MVDLLFVGIASCLIGVAIVIFREWHIRQEQQWYAERSPTRVPTRRELRISNLWMAFLAFAFGS